MQFCCNYYKAVIRYSGQKNCLKEIAMKKLLACLLLLVCAAGSAWTEEITVAAAANIAPAVEELADQFEARNPGITVTVISGSSGKLSTQIRNGAPFDIFLSADMGYAEDLVKAGFAKGPARVYAQGALILFVKKEMPSLSVSVLTAASIATIAIAKPELAPYGRAAVETMNSLGIFSQVSGKLVYAENISQAAQFGLAAADAAFINKSALFTDAYAPYRDKKGRNWIDIDPKAYAPIEQGAVILMNGAGKPGSELFYAFLYSADARKLFVSQGYLVP